MGGSCATRCGSDVATTATTSPRCWWRTPPRAPRCCSAVRCWSRRCRSRTLPGVPYHDHWLALVALAGGDLAYVDRPLYDYVQHRAAVQGALTRGPGRGHRLQAGHAAGAPPTSAAMSRASSPAQTLLARQRPVLTAAQAARAGTDGRRRANASARSPGWRCARCGACGDATRPWGARRRWPAGSSGGGWSQRPWPGASIPAAGRGMPASPTRRASSSGGCGAGGPAADQPIRSATEALPPRGRDTAMSIASRTSIDEAAPAAIDGRA